MARTAIYLGLFVYYDLAKKDCGQTVCSWITRVAKTKKLPGPDCRKLKSMLTGFPKAVPEIPVRNVEKAAAYYVNMLGFSFDWGNDQGGIGGISQGECRMFLTNAPFREHYGTGGSVVIWLNLDSKQEVDELYQRWREAGARILAEPEDKPWHLREFRVGDLDGNQLRVFYDFSWELRHK